jgi:hypothetical protein
VDALALGCAKDLEGVLAEVSHGGVDLLVDAVGVEMEERQAAGPGAGGQAVCLLGGRVTQERLLGELVGPVLGIVDQQACARGQVQGGRDGGL